MSDLKNIDTFQVEVLQELVSQWRGISNVEKRGLLALANEIGLAGQLVDVSVENLSSKFLLLAALAQNQSERLMEFSRNADHIEYKGNKIVLSEVFEAFDQDLTKNLNLLIDGSKKAVSLSYLLEDMNGVLQSMQAAKIEDSEVSASDLQRLDNDLKMAKESLQDIGSLDLSGKIEEKDRIVELVKSVIKESENMERELDETASDADILSSRVNEIITQLQFQDRTNQRLTHVSTTLRVIAGMLDAIEKEALCVDGIGPVPEINKEWVDKIISDMHLGEIRERFVKLALIEGNDNLFHEDDQSEEIVAHSTASDDIELF